MCFESSKGQEANTLIGVISSYRKSGSYRKERKNCWEKVYLWRVFLKALALWPVPHTFPGLLFESSWAQAWSTLPTSSGPLALGRVLSSESQLLLQNIKSSSGLCYGFCKDTVITFSLAPR